MLLERSTRSLLLVGFSFAVVVAACGSGRTGYDDPESGSSSGDGTSSSSGGPIGSSSGSSGGEDAGLGACAVEAQVGKALPLDIHILLDASGSMMQQTGAGGSGPTKWAEVKNALTAFINDPKSAGIGVGLEVFPIKHAGAPASCSSNAQCTVGGANLGRCFLKACVPAAQTDPIRSCDTAADCPGNAPCRDLGECTAGIFITGDCLVGDPVYGSCLIGTCKSITSAKCEGEECVVPDYESALVPIASLPSNAFALATAINAQPNPPPEALTPTGAALQGGLTYAKSFATSNPGHVVVLVLATDGLPTRCTPQDIPGIAALANGGATGTPAIKTFVIGVFSDAEKAQATTNLNAIATGGGTGNAFIVSTGSSVTTQFQAALEAIRGQALPCEYSVPIPKSGIPDYSKVNVQYTTGTSPAQLIPNRKNAGACDATGGWYYDVDPSQGTPTKIILCPTSCDGLKKSPGSTKLEVLLGCKTVVK